MPRKQTNDGKQKSVVNFENSLHEEREVYTNYGRVKVSVDAKVTGWTGHYTTEFYVDASSCPKDGDNIKNEEDKENDNQNPSIVKTNDDDERSNDDLNPIILYILISIPGVFFLVGFIYMCRTLCLPSLKEKCCIELEKKDDNPDYGTYYYSDGDRRQDIMEVAL